MAIDVKVFTRPMSHDPLACQADSETASSAVVWDMDGTLLDSGVAVPAAFAAVFKTLTGREYGAEEIIAMYPLGPPSAIFAHVLGLRARESDLAAYHAELERRVHQVSVYPLVIETLERVSTAAVQAVFTGASREAAQLLLRVTGLESYFATVVTGDDAAPKPSPAGLLEICSQLGVAPARSAYVGDSALDIEAAQNAGMTPIRAGWGHLAHQTRDQDGVLYARAPNDVVHLWFGP